MPIHGYPGNVITANPTEPSQTSASGVWTTEQQLINQSAGRWPPPYYLISRSLRFNSADSAYLSRTPSSSPTSNQKFTLSCWFKRTALGGTYPTIYNANDAQVGGGYPTLSFANDTIYLQLDVGGTTKYWQTTQLFRDLSAWYHIVWAVDTTQATATDRMKLYVNGSLVTTYSTQEVVTQNGTFSINGTTEQRIGSFVDYGRYIDGYLTEFYMIDGQQLAASSFGQTDPSTGVWSPIKYTGTYGTNGFYLNFSDNSGTTATTLGKDSSGNGNNWTPNNFSVTAGAGNDSMVDSPTSYGTDTGAGGEVRGNYCTFNSVAPYTVSGTVTLSNGNLQYADSASSYGGAVGTIAVTTGKWYWEVTATTCPGNWGEIGVSQSYLAAHSPGSVAGSYAYQSDGKKFINGTASAYGASYTSGDIIGVALDMDAGTLVFYKNGSSQGTAITSLTGLIITPSVGDYYTLEQYVFNANFGQRAFAYTAPSGFKALCTQNLPTPTIGATSTTQAGKYFNPVLYSGNSSTQAITGVGFQPDFVWCKARSTAAHHIVTDAVRTAAKVLSTSQTAAESAWSDNAFFQSLNSDGFTLTGGGTGINTTGNTYVAWNWKANGAGSSNTAGTITSTVSASTTSGFSIVTYTGNGTSGATIGHGLGVAPSMIIVKMRSGIQNWVVYHTSLGNTKALFLDLTDAAATNSLYWNNTSPTSSLITLGSGNGTNASGSTYVAYCFAPVAGYSAFGSYTGNGSTDGPFVYLGFRPEFVMIKNITTAGTSWEMFDNARETSNLMDLELLANSSNAEGTYTYGDFVSNGFKLRSTNNGVNQSTATLVYMAFAESPFKYALAR